MRCAFSSSLLLIACATAGLAWNAPPHRLITRAALNTLPQQARARLAAETSNLVELYCLYPDRYVEIQQFGFVHKSPGPKTQEELHVYCFRPDGEPLHSATWTREEDLGSLVYMFERIVSNLSDKHEAEAAKYMGTLSHWIADSFSPPHVVPREQLGTMAAAPAGRESFDIHGAIERTLPEFTLGARVPRVLGTGLVSAAEALLDKCYAGGEQNYKDLPAMARAAYAGDQATLDTYRLRAGKTAAELLGDALFTLFTFAGK
jgi:hypothetical protein